ncbi:MAG TPA: zinc ABC transporter ATP-binding protein ZnuC [Methylomirabilota bacterium]|jgi:zinc transport system ATP-binding protein|nr:zinc ABC transporter ATP-binding protein ZnuC [Methylomirabilota bacterium]
MHRAEASLIAAEGVSLALGGRAILDGINLSVHSGEIVTLIGPNGAGKTSLVRVLLGLVPPDRGRVLRKPGLRVGYVPQRMDRDPVLPLDADRFLALAGRTSAERRRAALEEVGAGHVARQPFHALSGGELQRVLLARALLCDPDLLVLDEPVRGVDVGGQIALYDLVDKIRKTRRCGVLMVSHDLHLVMAATDQVICLNTHICCAGRPETVTRHPEYRALFGTAAERLAVYVHHHDHAHALAGEVLPIGDAGTHPHEHR